MALSPKDFGYYSKLITTNTTNPYRLGGTNGRNRKSQANHRNTCTDAYLHPEFRASYFSYCPICGADLTDTDPTEEESRKGPSIERIESPVPIIAKRRINISAGPGGPRLTTGHGEIEWVSEAKCSVVNHKTLTPIAISHPHTAPDLNCQCGFYAVPLDQSTESGYGSVELMVELYGTVIEHEKGYRAQWQRVLEVKFFGCWMCGDAAVFYNLEDGQTRCGKKFHKPIRSYKSQWVTVRELVVSLKKPRNTDSTPEDF